MRYFFTLLVVVTALLPAVAQSNFWQDFDESRIFLPENAEIEISAKKYRILSLDFDALRATLEDAPMEFTPEAAENPIRTYLPLPNGEMELMEVVESPVMAPELAAKFPSIRAFVARSVNNKLISARLDYSPKGFNAVISTPEGRAFVNPYATEQTRFCISYFYKDIIIDPETVPELSCGFTAFDEEEELDWAQQQALSEQANLSFRNNNEVVPLREYRLALACTGEYGAAKGGTVEAVMATYNTALSLLNQIFQLEFASRMVLIPGVENVIYLDPNTDPYIDANNGEALLDQNTEALAMFFPVSAYDVGHVFTMACEDVGGIAGGTICSFNKARGVTCHYNNINVIVTQVMAHEIGHQFSCGHSWNNCPPILEQLSSANAFEPGSGSTIMSYQGSCGINDINNVPLPGGDYYNIGSLEDFIFYARQGGGAGEDCGTTILTDNHQPVITLPYEDGFWIPISTPFELDCETEDIDGDALTYCWEQYDLGPNTNVGSPIMDSPLFRSFPPTPDSKRVFPRMQKIVGNYSDVYEVLPTYERNLTFQVTVRDNNPMYGGVVWEKVAFQSDGSAGPFLVSSPNTSDVSWKVGDYEEVTWDVANTDNNRVKGYYVDIKLSVDGGYTYPYTLVSNTPNDGSAFVTVPDAISNTARIRVEASDNIFFDISNEDFEIEEATEPGYTFDINPVAVPLYCAPNGPITVDILSSSILGYDSTLTLNLIGDLPSYATASFAETTITAGSSTTLTIDFDDFIGRDTIDLMVEAVEENANSILRELRIVALSNNFSGLAMESPVDGATSIVFTTDFSWTEVTAASTYDIEIATSPSFAPSTIVETASGLEVTDYSPEFIFDENTIYYWRIRPVNDCGPQEYLVPFAFQTSTVDCAINVPQDLPIALPNNPTVRTSNIFVPTNGTISDLNITDLNITYNPVNSIRITLVSPAGTEAILFDQNCLNTGSINLEFDDEAPNDIICPPIGGNPMRPENPLSVFDGEDTFGDWMLEVRVVTSGFGGGSINNWNIEFCATVSLTPPSLIRNETLAVPPGQSNVISTDYLEVQDEASTPADIRYVLITVPSNGQLYRAGDNEPLTPGEIFTQETINSFNLSYVHDGSATTEDKFYFLVENELGGWIPSQVFNIEIDENAVVNTDDLNINNSIELFPNPANKMAQLRLQQPLSEDGQIYLRNTQGQIVQSLTMKAGATALEINTSKQAAGVYLVEVHSGENVLSKKLMIQH
ncbi:MAG: M12 family metallo-peptidase [Chitinophagales bacterium]|nr:M12 family metallo-peptidase [Chitinophagales bacterium]